MLMPHGLGQVAHTLAVLTVVFLIWTGVRWVVHRSHIIGAMFVAGVLTRLVLGVALFTISYLRLPIASAFQLGEGFWVLTSDARAYYQLAAHIARTGAPLNPASVPSPFFIRTLALWMSVVGISPLAGMFLNLCLYTAVVVALTYTFRPTNDWHRDLPAIVGIGAYSFSPVILIHATQPLKDELSGALMISACLGMLALRRVVYGHRVVQGWTLLGMVTLCASGFGTAGIRWYYALILWNAAAITLTLCGLWRRTVPLPKYAAGTAAALLVGWLGLWAGAGPFYPTMTRYMTQGPAHLGMVTQLSRRGFLMSGGRTNVVVPIYDDPAAGKAQEHKLVREHFESEIAFFREQRKSLRTVPSRTFSVIAVIPLRPARSSLGTRAVAEPPTPRVDAVQNANSATTLRTLPSRVFAGAIVVRLPQRSPLRETNTSAEAGAPVATFLSNEAARAVPVRVLDHVRVVATGLSFVFLPTSLATHLLGVEIAGGRGLLPIAEVDTIFQDVTLILIAVLLWQRRRQVADRLPLVIFGILLGVSTACLLAYVVTNFGTMWRLRSLVAIPFWMSFLALAPRRDLSRGDRT